MARSKRHISANFLSENRNNESFKSSLLKNRYKTPYLENASNIHQKIPVTAKIRITESLRKNVCVMLLRFYTYTSNDKLPPENKLPQKMVSHVDMFRVRRTDWVLCRVPCPLVILKKRYARRTGIREIIT